jgi:hypothetical protein
MLGRVKFKWDQSFEISKYTQFAYDIGGGNMNMPTRSIIINVKVYLVSIMWYVTKRCIFILMTQGTFPHDYHNNSR